MSALAEDTDADLPVAIVGLACRTAGADSPEALWELLIAGRRMIAAVPAHRLPAVDPGPVAVDVPHAALMDDIDKFDASFFGISRRMASWMDPHQRMLLELTWHALDNAGLDSRALRGLPVGVFAAAPMADYRERMVAAGVVDSAAFPGTLITFVANRISYEFDWTGPSYALDSACSSGLSVLAPALHGLRAGEFPIAAVMGANLTCNGFYTSSAYRGGALSPTSDSVPFSARRDGYIRGEGGACLILKRLGDAVRDGDPIHAVIRGVGLGHNGRAGGLTGTEAGSQASLIVRTARACKVPLRSVGYLEAHGTGTRGDIDEVDGVTKALRDDAESVAGQAASGPDGKLWIGSIKANIGHLETAAGLLGVVKAALILRHGLIPRIAGFERVDPAIDLDGLPVAIADREVRWPAGDVPRRIGVNSFGVGGAMAHAILEEAPARADDVVQYHDALVFPLSAVDNQGLTAVAGDLLSALDTVAAPIDTIAWTLQSGRPALRVRRAALVADLDHLRDVLAAISQGKAHHDVLTAESAPCSLKGADAIVGWLDGGDIDWRPFWPEGRTPRRVSLPGYPFVHRSHWFNTDVPTIPLAVKSDS